MGRAKGATQTQTYFAHGVVAPKQPLVQREYESADRDLRRFDEAMGIARKAHAEGRQELATDTEVLAWRIVREADPVRLAYAAAVLGVADQTVRDWVDAELLEDFDGTPQRVGLESVARVRELIRDLRSKGQQRNLMTAVLRALELDELQRDDRFQQSLEQMRRGERA